MGILNVTPDSFSDGGRFATVQEAVDAGLKMVEEGAVIIDVGGESTRPGAQPVSVQEELDRVLEVVHGLAKEGVCVSIDTRHAEVAAAAVQAGASIINDVSGFRDPAMVDVAAGCSAGVVVMHMAGTGPQDMQDHAQYVDVVDDVRNYLASQAHMLENAGVARGRICIDPGPGFGKTAKQTVSLLRNLHEFVHLGYPVMAAVSRKGFLEQAYRGSVPADTDLSVPENRDQVSAAEALAACEMGASVVRTHNVALTVETLRQGLRPYALIGAGCNVPLVAEPGEELEGKKDMLNKAIGDMCMMPDTIVVDVAPFYESEPAYVTDQDTFVNTVVLLRTGLPPQQLLRCLQAIEDSLGRVREKKNGPRTCDLDILDFQGYVSDLEVLTLPHPLLTERDFVYKPLSDILPNHVLANDVPVTEEAVTVGRAWRC